MLKVRYDQESHQFLSKKIPFIACEYDSLYSVVIESMDHAPNQTCSKDDIQVWYESHPSLMIGFEPL